MQALANATANASSGGGGGWWEVVEQHEGAPGLWHMTEATPSTATHCDTQQPPPTPPPPLLALAVAFARACTRAYIDSDRVSACAHASRSGFALPRL